MSTNPDAAKVRRIESHNANAMRWYAAGDADSVANLFAADAWQMPPNAPLWWGGRPSGPSGRTRWTGGGTGDMGYTTGRNRLTMPDPTEKLRAA